MTAGPTPHSGSTVRRSGLRRCAGWPLVAVLLITAGCGGCRRSKDGDEEKRAEAREQLDKGKERKPDFEMADLRFEPDDETGVNSYVKPGHWMSGTVELIANNFNFPGELSTVPLPLDGMSYSLTSARRVPLAKGQTKRSRVTIYIPSLQSTRNVTTRLGSWKNNRRYVEKTHPVGQLLAHQYFFVVLSHTADSFAFLKQLESIRSVRRFSTYGYYRVSLNNVDSRVPLPDTPLAWTSIAYVLWDDIEPGLLEPAQQRAMLDWLQWGGQLIVTGTGALDKLRGSFLEPYLPAGDGGPLDITQEMFRGLNAQRPGDPWTPLAESIRIATPWSGRQLVPADGRPAPLVLATADGHPLVVERRVGRGRIVATAFLLQQRGFLAWPEHDNFFNALLLRRPPRKFAADELGESLGAQWVESDFRPYDPRAMTGLRYFNRDALNDPFATWKEQVKDTNYVDPKFAWAQGQEYDAWETIYVGPGTAGWNDYNAVAAAARESLRDAAGIVVPDAEFVLKMVALYLLFLVPVNWGLFRLIGRVEWAWIAAPAIAVVFGVVVVQQAQLDIGFARSRTEIGVIELYSGHPRAHLTRYLALYTSLSTGYQFKADAPGALLQPFRTDIDEGRRSRREIAFRPESTHAQMHNFFTASNSTGMVHAERMIDLDGAIRLRTSERGPVEVVNATGLSLVAAAVLWRPVPEDRSWQMAWLGDFPEGETAKLDFIEIAATDAAGSRIPASRSMLRRYWDSVPLTASDSQHTLRLRDLVDIASNSVEPGELRLVACLDGGVAGLSIRPQANQLRQASLVVAHLGYDLRGDEQRLPRPDANRPPQPKPGVFTD